MALTLFATLGLLIAGYALCESNDHILLGKLVSDVKTKCMYPNLGGKSVRQVESTTIVQITTYVKCLKEISGRGLSARLAPVQVSSSLPGCVEPSDNDIDVWRTYVSCLQSEYESTEYGGRYGRAVSGRRSKRSSSKGFMSKLRRAKEGRGRSYPTRPDKIKKKHQNKRYEPPRENIIDDVLKRFKNFLIEH